MIMYLNGKKFEYKEAKIILHIDYESVSFVVESNVNSFKDALKSLEELQWLSTESLKNRYMAKLLAGDMAEGAKIAAEAEALKLANK